MTFKPYIKKITLAVISSAFLLTSGTSIAANQLIPRNTINKTLIKQLYQYKENSTVSLDRIVVKFKEGTGIRLRSGQLQRLTNAPTLPTKLNLTSSNLGLQLTNIMSNLQNSGLQMKSAFGNNEALLTRLKQIGEQKTGKELADLNLYFNIPIPSWMSKKQINQYTDMINNMSSVEISYAVPKAEIASLTPDFQDADPSDPFKPFQGYLEETSQHGIDAKYAWTFAGGKGSGVKIVDVEGGWSTGHEDFPAMFYTGGTMSTDAVWVDHGTAVMGIISGVENDFGVTGIAPNAQIGYSAYTQGTDVAITNAADAVGEGGVVLIELHREGPTLQETCNSNASQCNFIGVEYWQADFDAIQTATANGVIVVEAAGNGSANLDDPIYSGKFDRTQRDSGAILVGAGYSNIREPMVWSNYGSRVDVHGWGEDVTTTGYGNLYKLDADQNDKNYWYTSSFSGTSSASPIIVGAVASIQGISLANNGELLSPSEMRDLIVNTGSVQTASTERHVGPLPDLRNAIDTLLAGVDPGDPECVEYTDTITNHETASRVYTETTAGFWWLPGTTTYYAFGSDENLGTSSSSTVTLIEEPADVFIQGTCPEIVDPVPPSIDSYSVDVIGTTITVTGTASDANNDITEVHILYAYEPGNLTCSGTTDFTCTFTQDPGTYSFYLQAVDGEGNVSDPSETFDITINEASGACEYATNVDHIAAGRAYECTILFSPHACATGSDEDLGYTGNPYWRPTSSVEETSPGNWSLVSECP